MVWPFLGGVLAVVVVLAVVAFAVVLPAVNKVKADVVRFQKAAQNRAGRLHGPDRRARQAGSGLGGRGRGRQCADHPSEQGGGEGPTPPVERPGGGERVRPASRRKGTFGGTGSDRVCDREKLLKHLVAKPDRLPAWARRSASSRTARRSPPTYASSGR